MCSCIQFYIDLLYTSKMFDNNFPRIQCRYSFLFCLCKFIFSLRGNMGVLSHYHSSSYPNRRILRLTTYVEQNPCREGPLVKKFLAFRET
jgi:hypothetical protein